MKGEHTYLVYLQIDVDLKEYCNTYTFKVLFELVTIFFIYV